MGIRWSRGHPNKFTFDRKYEEISRAIAVAMTEDIGREHVDCGVAPGGCPIDFDEEQKEWALEEEDPKTTLLKEVA